MFAPSNQEFILSRIRELKNSYFVSLFEDKKIILLRVNKNLGIMGLIYPNESRELMRLAFQLHQELGCGFREKIYQDAFEVLLKENHVPYIREAHISLNFHGTILAHDFYYDFLCYDKIGIELKAVSELIGEYESQLINYLHVSNHKLGLLLNFGKDSLQYKWFPNVWHHRKSKEIQNSRNS